MSGLLMSDGVDVLKSDGVDVLMSGGVDVLMSGVVDGMQTPLAQVPMTPQSVGAVHVLPHSPLTHFSPVKQSFDEEQEPPSRGTQQPSMPPSAPEKRGSPLAQYSAEVQSLSVEQVPNGQPPSGWQLPSAQ
jgi:hypothetical protein